MGSQSSQEVLPLPCEMQNCKRLETLRASEDAEGYVTVCVLVRIVVVHADIRCALHFILSEAKVEPLSCDIPRPCHTLDRSLAGAGTRPSLYCTVRRVRPRISFRSQRFVYSTTLVAEPAEHITLRSPELSPTTVCLAWPFDSIWPPTTVLAPVPEPAPAPAPRLFRAVQCSVIIAAAAAAAPLCFAAAAAATLSFHPPETQQLASQSQ